MLIFRSPIIPSIGPSFCFIEGRSNGNLICIQQVLLSRLLEHVIRDYGISFKANVLRNFVHSQFFFSSRLKVCLFFFSTNTICVQLISTIIRNQFDTIYNLLQRTKSTTIARHFFFRTHICFLPPPASHFTSKAGLALRFKLEPKHRESPRQY